MSTPTTAFTATGSTEKKYTVEERTRMETALQPTTAAVTVAAAAKMQIVLRDPQAGTALIISPNAPTPKMLCGDFLTSPNRSHYYVAGMKYFYGHEKPRDATRRKPLPMLPYSDRHDNDTREILRYARGNLDYAQSGDPDTTYHTARCILLGARDNGSNTTVAKFFKKSGEEGHIPGLVAHAVCLENGFGTQQDKAQAARIYEYAAKLNDPDAMYALACMLLSEDILQRDVPYAIYLLTQAVERHHHARAQFLLGRCYAEGLGVPKDDVIATDLFFQATVEGEDRARAAIGKKPADIMTPAGVRWVAKSTEPRDLRADFELAMRYFEGKTLPQHLEQAILRFETIARADLSNPDRQKPGWYWCSNSEEELKQLCENEVRAIELLGICYEKRAAYRAPNASSVKDDLLSFHFRKKSEQRALAYTSKQKLVFQTAEDRTIHSLDQYRDPLGANFKAFLQALTTVKDLNTEVLMLDGGQDLTPERFVMPTKNLVLCQKGTGGVKVDVSRIECANLYIVCSGNLNFNENSILKVHGNLFCLSNTGVNLDNCKVEVGRVFAIIGAREIQSSTESAGSISATLGLFLGRHWGC